MKNLFLLVLCLFSICANSQNTTDDTYEKGSLQRLDQMGKAYISEIKKVANISYNSDVSLNISIRKERSFSNSAVSKDIYFTGTTADGACEGFIDESEADDAIKALKYISDSLLSKVPENETHFAKRFANSYFVIYASYVPGSGKVFGKAEWDINIQLNEHDTDSHGPVRIKRSDVGMFIQILQTCKEKLKTF